MATRLPGHTDAPAGTAPAAAAAAAPACGCDGGCADRAATVAPADRAATLARALVLEYLTIAWNLVEGAVSVAAALAAGSTALLGFGIDSFVESLSGGVLVWRLRAERRNADPAHVAALEHRARRLVAISLFTLAAYVAVDSALALLERDKPQPSIAGIVITVLSIGAMQWLARAKRRAAADLDSRALASDAVQTSACFWLSIVTLTGIGLNALFGWWWADPVAALGVAALVAYEGREAWRGEACCC